MGQPDDTLWPSQPRTLLKHQVYRRYLDCWMGKVCQAFSNSAIVDAFAGPGIYRDGPDGSPVVIAKTFLQHSRRERFGLLRLVCLEKRPDRHAVLSERLERLPRLPRLSIVPPYRGDLWEHFAELRGVAHGSDSGTPVLWILDPFDISSVPFTLVKACLAGPRDEVLVTWFADEIYRFCGDLAKERALDRHFGTAQWREARQVRPEGVCKQELLKIYQENIRTLPGVHTAAFEIASKNEAARYALVFATHSDAGMACFNRVRWGIDPYRGRNVSEKRGLAQGSLLDEMPVLDSLRHWLASLAGQAASFDDLARQAARRGFEPKHLRSALSSLADDGLAVREEPLDARTPWPAGCTVRFYPPPG